MHRMDELPSQVPGQSPRAPWCQFVSGHQCSRLRVFRWPAGMAWANSTLRGNDLVAGRGRMSQILRSLAPPSRSSLDCTGNAIDLLFLLYRHLYPARMQ
jgi:hypothetical protein